MRSPLTLALGAGLVAGLVVVPAGAWADTGIGEVEQVSAPGIASDDAVLAADSAGHAWAAFTAVDAATGSISVQVSERRGALGWAAPTVLSRHGVDARAPHIASNDQGDVCVTWVEESWAHERLQTACHLGAEWTESVALGPLAARIESATLAVADSGDAAVAFTALSPDLSTQMVHAAWASEGRWSASSAVDVTSVAEDSLSDVQIAHGAEGEALVVWRRDDAVLSSRRTESAMWSPAHLQYAGAASSVAAGGADGRMMAAWAADGKLSLIELGAVGATPQTVPWDTDVIQLQVVPLADSSGAVLLATDSDGQLGAVTMGEAGSGGRTDIGAAARGFAVRLDDDGVHVALSDDSAGVSLARVDVSGAIPALDETRVVVTQISGATSTIVLAEPRALLIWVDDALPSAIFAAEVLDDPETGQ